MKRHALSCLAISTLFGLSALSTSVSATQYYKWVDAQGSTHYTKTPPPRNAKKQGSVNTYSWANSAPTPARTADTTAQEQTQSTPNTQPQSPIPNIPQQEQNTENKSPVKSPSNSAEL